MDLRMETLPLFCELDREKVENLFRQEEVTIKYNLVTQSNRFRRKLKRISTNLANIVEEIEDSEGEIEEIKDLISEDNIIKAIKISVMISTLSIAINKIIFEGRTPEEAVTSIITVTFMLEILDLVESWLMEEIDEIVTSRQVNKLFLNWLNKDS